MMFRVQARLMGDNIQTWWGQVNALNGVFYFNAGDAAIAYTLIVERPGIADIRNLWIWTTST